MEIDILTLIIQKEKKDKYRVEERFEQPALYVPTYEEPLEEPKPDEEARGVVVIDI